MAYTPTRDRNSYAPKGAGRIVLHELTDALAEMTPTAGYYDLGFLDSTELTDETPFTGQYDEGGNQYANDEGNRAISLTGVLAQRNQANINHVFSARNSYFLLYQDRGASVGGKGQDLFGFGQIEPSLRIPLPGGKWTFKFNFLKNESAYTISTAVLAGTGTAGFNAHATVTVTLAAVPTNGTAGYYTIVET